MSSHTLKSSWSSLSILTSHIVLLPILGTLIQHDCLIIFWNSLLLPSVPVYNISVSWYLLCNARYCAAISSLSSTVFVSPVYSHNKTPSSLILYLYFQCAVHALTRLTIFSLRTLLIWLLHVVCLPFLCHCCCLFCSIHLHT
jgi:hypothetical protein